MAIQTNENYEKLCDYIKTKESFLRTGNDAKYQTFLEQYPLSKIADLTKENYCLGTGVENSFCWWIERGLKDVIGGYGLGSAYAHIIFKHNDGEYRTLKALESLDIDKAQEVVSNLHSVIANIDTATDYLWVDDNSKIRKKVNTQSKLNISASRKLRLLSVYNIDDVLPIASVDHIEHFLLALGCDKESIPNKNKPVERMLLLKKYFEKIKNEINHDLTTYSFVKALYSEYMDIDPRNKVKAENTQEIYDQINHCSDPDVLPHLNQILYGPPGTGKTFNTSCVALKICEPDLYNEMFNKDDSWEEFYQDVKVEYDKLVNDGRIVFTTFHQSFAYEDFIEGLKANVDEETKAINYSVESGIFKELCETASSKTTLDSKEKIILDGKRIWKMSLGNTLTDDDSIYQECIENNYVALGYGDDIDFTGCDTKNAVRQKLSSETQQELKDNDYSLTSVHCLKNVIRKGDIIIISDGNRKFRAIAEVTGDYAFLNSDERTGYQQLRPVKWHKVFEPSLSKEKLFKKSLSQMTLYELRPKTIDTEKLSGLLNPKTTSVTLKQPHVIIIDEINRGNISSIFGELITLIEPDKRKGREFCQTLVLPHSKKPFSVPDNVYIIGTMNTADRSLTQLDIALRRRFDFIEMMPDPSLLDTIEISDVEISLEELLYAINERIEFLLDRDHTIGHSYFMQVETIEDLENIFKNKVIPLLQEYFYEDWERIRLVLNDQNKAEKYQFIKQNKQTAEKLFGKDVDDLPREQTSYSINDDAFMEAQSYLQIIGVDDSLSVTNQSDTQSTEQLQ